VTKMVSVTKKVPKTIYVDVVTQEPREEQVVVNECRTKTVRIPYQVNVPETQYRTVQERVPVSRTKTVYDNVQKTVYDTQVRTQCVPETRMVTKEVPVYRVVARSPSPCGPNGGDCGDCGQVQPVMPEPQPCPDPQPMPDPQPPMQKVTIKTEYSAPRKYDTDGDGVLDENERALAAAQGELRVEKREVVEDENKQFLQKPLQQEPDGSYRPQPQPPLGPNGGGGGGYGGGNPNQGGYRQQGYGQSKRRSGRSSSRRRKSGKSSSRRKKSRRSRRDNY